MYVSILTAGCGDVSLSPAIATDVGADPMPAKASSGVVAAPKPFLMSSCVSVAAKSKSYFYLCACVRILVK